MNKFEYLHYFLLLLARECLAGADVSDLDNKTELLDGKYVYGLGTKFNNPLLRLIGKAFMRNEKQQALQQQTTLDRLCELHPCMEWGSWSTCPATKGQFAMVTRSRDCSKTDKCPQTRPENLITTESKVCECALTCPSSYEKEGSFCLKLYSSPTKSKPDARTVCKNDGGYLVHIDSKTKSDAVHALISRHGYSNTLWINGERKTAGGPWTYEYGSEPDFDIWKPGEPSNGSAELCKIDRMYSYNGYRYWFDRECTNKYGIVCEYV